MSLNLDYSIPLRALAEQRYAIADQRRQQAAAAQLQAVKRQLGGGSNAD